MEINTVFNGLVFPHTGMKLLMCRPFIERIINDYMARDFSNWKDEETCPYCHDGKLCKRHLTLDRGLHMNYGVKIDGLSIDYDHMGGPYVNKSTLVCWNKYQNSILTIDFPPFFTSKSPKTDRWIRKITPFSLGNVLPNDKPNVTEAQCINIRTVSSKYREFEYMYTHSDNNSMDRIKIISSFGGYVWDFKSYKRTDEEGNN